MDTQTEYAVAAPLSILKEKEIYIRPDGSTFTRDDIFVKLFVTFRDDMLAKLKGPKLSVYLCIALHCDSDMKSWPSIRTIMRETGYSNRAVIDATAELEETGLVSVLRQEQKNNQYTIHGFLKMGRGNERSSVGSESRSHGPSELESHKEEPCKKKPIKKKIAEAAISPPDDSLWPEDSNFPPRKETTEEKPLTATDPLTLAAECASRSEGKKSWTVTAEAGGADPYQDGPLVAACTILRIDPDSLAEEEKRTWARQLKRITKAVKGGTPRLFVEACKAWSSAYEWKGKSGAPYSNVFRGAFPDDLQMLMRQVKSGTVTTSEVRISN